ncbi:MAG: helix-turn-helix domain-containing protein [Dysosmobacter welbionis]
MRKRVFSDDIFREIDGAAAEVRHEPGAAGRPPGVTRQSVSKWEGGTAMPELVKLISLSELFGVSVDYLVKDWMEEPDNPCGGSGEISSKQADRLEKKVDELTNYVKGRVYRYDSKTRIFGLPLVSIRFGFVRNGKLSMDNTAKGIIAIGNCAIGVVAIGIVGVGLFTFGVLAMGMLSLGIVAGDWRLSAWRPWGIWPWGSAPWGSMPAAWRPLPPRSPWRSPPWRPPPWGSSPPAAMCCCGETA